jgi:hypothetical protein
MPLQDVHLMKRLDQFFRFVAIGVISLSATVPSPADSVQPPREPHYYYPLPWADPPWKPQENRLVQSLRESQPSS